MGSRSLALQLLCARPEAAHVEHTRGRSHGGGERNERGGKRGERGGGEGGGGGGEGGGGGAGYAADDAQLDVVSSTAAWSLDFAVNPPAATPQPCVL